MRILLAALATCVAGVSAGSVVAAQGWSIDVSAGRTVYDPLAATLGTNSLIGTVQHEGRRSTWVYGSAAAPAGEGGTFWTAAGAGGRLMRTPGDGPVTVGANLGGHGFWFRDRVVSLSGTGGTLEALPFVHAAFGDAFVEGSGGWRGHTLAFAGVRENRGVFETGLRGGVSYMGGLHVEGNARWVHAAEGTYPVAAATVAWGAPRGGVWVRAGKWLAADVTDHLWGVGGALNLGTGTSVWAAIRREGPDPLYWNLPRRSWSVGLTRRLGRRPSPVLPLPQAQNGVITVRLPARDAPAGPISIAGDFNNWQPAPMVREGDAWVARLSLAPGVYHYAFRTAEGEWFVPPSTAGRRDDGMGGHQAVLVVG